MRKIAAILFTILVAASSALAQDNWVTFDNQSGEPALVKLIGPTTTELEVANGSRGTVAAAAGCYEIKVRYGVPGKFHYAKGKEFDVTQTATTRSETTITLHKLVGGNYEFQDITEAEFGMVVASRKTDAPSPRPEVIEGTRGILGEYIAAGPWRMRVTSFKISDTFVYQHPSGIQEPVEVKPRNPKMKVATVRVLLTPTRTYTAKERNDLEGNSFCKAALEFAKVFDADKIVTNSDFYLGYFLADQTETLKFHACQFLIADKGSPNGISIKNRDPAALSAWSYAIFAKDEDVVARLVFSDWPSDQKATLFFIPFSSHKQMVIATIVCETSDGKLQVQYGDTRDMKSVVAKKVPGLSR